MADWVLDASAVLALMRAEPGAERVAEALPTAQLASVNAGEVVAQLILEGVAAETARPWWWGSAVRSSRSTPNWDCGPASWPP